MIDRLLPDSLQRVVRVLERRGVGSPSAARRLLCDADISADDIMPWADFDHSAQDSYGRKLVWQGDNYELMVMSWAPGDFSAIHDHGETQWGAVLYLGEAEHAIFDIADGVLHTVERTSMFSGDVNEVSNALIHQMGNRSTTAFLSVHLYGCDQPTDTITGDARIFDLLERKIQYTDGGVFYCLPEDQIKRRTIGISADTLTTQEHHRQMLSRVNAIQNTRQSTGKMNALSQRLRRELQKLELRRSDFRLADIR